MKTETMQIFEYGAMSSRYSCEAENKLTAYCAMCAHYDQSNHLLVIYSPESSKNDNWFSPTGQVSERLDEVFGGDGNFDKYWESHIEEIRICYNSIKKIV